MTDTASVYYPHGGHHFLAHYWSYNERGHIMLARSEDQILNMAKSIFAESHDAELRAYSEIEIVAPPPSFFELRDQAELKERISIFAIDIRGRMRDLIEASIELPAPFLACDKYEPESPEDHDDEYDKTYHCDCKNCKDRIVVKLSDVELYAKYGSEWEKKHPPHLPDRRRVVPSRAPVANEGEELRYVWPNFGHHAGGIELRMVGTDTFSMSEFIHSSALFFYRLVSEKDDSALKAILTAEAEKAKAKRVDHSDQWKIDRDNEDRVRLEETIAFFKEFK